MATRLAWIGVAHIHVPGFTNEVLKRGIQCAGVWDHDDARARKAAEKLDGPVRSILEMVQDPSVGGFVVTSETNRHLELVGQIVGAAKPVFIEKPMGFDAKQSRQIRKLLEDHHIAFQTGYFRRGDPALRAVKKKVEEGFFGTITRVRASNCHSGALGGWFDGEWRWMADRKQAGVGAFGDLGTHVLDVLLWIFGDITSATGAFGQGTNRYPGCEEFGEAMFRFKSGAVGTLAAGWDDVADPVKLQVSGTKGYAILRNELEIAGPDGKFEKVEVGEPVAAGFPAFLDHLEGKKAELVTPAEAAMRDLVMDAVYMGAEKRAWVDVSSV
jgi:predicted dehydrogenase